MRSIPTRFAVAGTLLSRLGAAPSAKAPGTGRAALSRLTLRALLCAAAAGLLAAPCGAAIPSAEKLLPDDTLAMVTIPDAARLRELWKSCPQALLWNDPAMKPFKDAFLARWQDQFVKPLERDLGVSLGDYANLPQGQLTFAVTQGGWTGSSDSTPGMVLLADTRDKKDELKKDLADLRKKWVAAGKSLRRQVIRGTEFSIVPISGDDLPKMLRKAPAQAADASQDDEEPKDAPKRELVVGQFESLLIAGNSTQAVEKIMAHLTGGSMPSLGDLAGYEADRLALFRTAPFCGWVNLKSLLDLLNRKPEESADADGADPMAMLNPARILRAVGFAGLKTLAFNFQYTDEGSSVQVLLDVPESARQGLLKLCPGPGKDSGPPPFVPADAAKFRRCRIDGQKTWATLQSIMNEINPQLLSGLNFLLDTANTAAKQKDPDFDIKKNLFGNLGDDIISYEKAPRDNPAGGVKAAPSLYLISSPQPAQLAAALKSIGALWNPQGGPPTEREFLGRKIFTLPLPGMPLPAADPSAPQGPRILNCAASAGYVALSTDAALLEEYLRSSDGHPKELRQAPGMVAAAAKVGGTSTGWFGYENEAQTSRLAFEQLRRIPAADTNAADAAFSGSAGFSPGQFAFTRWMDFSLLPPFEKISRYFYFSVYSAGATPAGLSFNWFAPTPPALRK